ncbi:hypothetical protein PAXRUDRAFT_61778, partial [Paxillus rubicundulus Ve08.2h10]
QPVCRAAKCFVMHPCSSLHYLFHAFNLPPDNIESLVCSCYSPSTTIPYQTSITKTREAAIAEHDSVNDPIHIYCDGSGVGGKIGAAAVLHDKEHTIYEVEAVGLTLAAKFLASKKDPSFPISIYVNNQAVLQSGENPSAKPGYYILSHFHRMIHMIKK